MAREAFNQQIVLTGAEEVVADLERVGKAGDQAIGKLQEAVAKVDLSGLSTGAAKAEKPIAQLSQTVVEGARTFDYAANDAWRLSKGFETIGIMGARGYKAAETVGTAVSTAGEAARGASKTLRDFSSSLTGLGRAARIPALGRLGGALRLMLNPMIAIPGAIALAITALFKFGNAAAETAKKIQDNAAALRMTPQVYQKATSAGYSLGISQDKMTKSLGAFNQMAVKSKEQTEASEKAYENATKTLEDLRAAQADSAYEASMTKQETEAIEVYTGEIGKLNDRIYELNQLKKSNPEYAEAVRCRN